MKQLSALQNIVYRMGAVLMVVGAAVFPFSHVVACGLFVSGVVLYTLVQLQQSYEGGNLIVQRLRRQQLAGLCCLVVSALAMALLVWDFSQGSFRFRFVHHNEWVVLLAIGALLQLYTAFRIPADLEKEERR